MFMSSTGLASTMKKVGVGRASHKSSGPREKNYIKEDSSNVSEEAEQNVIEEENGSKCVEVVKSSSISDKTSDTSMASPTTIEKLPQELLTNIFLRLYAKQVSQMRSVCKPWNTLISEPSFVKSHLLHFTHNNMSSDQKILMAFHSSVCTCSSRPYTALHSPSPHVQLTARLPPSDPDSRYITSNLKVVGAVNGLICISNDDYSVIRIQNFSLSAVSTLPPSCTPSHLYSEDFIRFGYDPQTDDYKVVKITGIINWDQKLSSTKGTIRYLYSIQKWLQVQVYSMRKGAWEFITARVPSHLKILIDMDHLCVDGHDGRLHWLAASSKKGNTDFNSIATFDLSSHTFGEIRFPDSSKLNHHNYINVVGVLSGKLCVILQGDAGAFEVWVMDDDTWVKRHAFSLSTEYESVFGFTCHGELLAEHDDGYLVLYDPCANKTKYFKGFCCRQRGRPAHVMEFVDSLVWIPAQPQPLPLVAVVDGQGQISNGDKTSFS